MKHGKETCNYLKAIRHAIAEENEIDLPIPRCSHKGNCLCTCTQCKAEVQYHETVLSNRISLGKAAVVTGIALALGSPAVAQNPVKDTTAQETRNNAPIDISSIIAYEMGAISQTAPIDFTTHPSFGTPTSIHATLINELDMTHAANALILCKDKDHNVLAQCVSDIDGHFTIDHLPADQAATLHIRFAGYQEKVIPLQQSHIDWSDATIYLNDGRGKGTIMGQRSRSGVRAEKTIPIIEQHGIIVLNALIREPMPYALVRAINEDEQELFRGYTDMDSKFYIEYQRWLNERHTTVIVEYAGCQPATIYDPMPRLKKRWITVTLK